MLKHPTCPCCGNQIPAYFWWSAGLHARRCPHCDKNIRLANPQTFVLGFLAITFSWVPGQLISSHHWLAGSLIVLALLGGFALLVIAISAGLTEESDSTSLSL